MKHDVLYRDGPAPAAQAHQIHALLERCPGVIGPVPREGVGASGKLVALGDRAYGTPHHVKDGDGDWLWFRQLEVDGQFACGLSELGT
jgi:hypothetical protein